MTFQIGDYIAEQQIARGSSAEVWAGRHRRTGQRVALKLFGPDGTDQATRESAIAASVDHPHLLQVVGVVANGENVALVTALADGGCLSDVLDRRQMTAGELVTVMFPIAAVLAAAHELDILHGDLSPGNILFESNGRPVLADLGAARASAEVCRRVAATPGYVAPEVAEGSAPTSAADIFALGAVALHCLTGKPAWPADELADVVVQSIGGQLPKMVDSEAVSPKLVDLINRMLDLEPRRRPSAAAVLMDLKDAESPVPVDLSDEPGEARVGLLGNSGGDDGPAGHPAAQQLRPQSRADMRARALTRLRADTPVRGVPERPRFDWRARGLKTVASAVLVVALAGGAVAAGLSWAASDQAPPSVIAGDAGSGDAGESGSESSALSSVAVPAGSMPVGSVGSVALVVPVASVASVTPAAVLDSGNSVPVSDPDGRSPDWTAVIEDLDRRRSVAFSATDKAALHEIYTTDSALLEQDMRLIDELLSSGMSVAGSRHVQIQVEEVSGNSGSQPGGSGAGGSWSGADDPGAVTVRVTDTLPAYPLRSADGSIVAHTQGRDEASRLVQLVPVGGAYRIAAVSPEGF